MMTILNAPQRSACILLGILSLASVGLAKGKQPKGDGLTSQEIIDTVQKYSEDQKACYSELLEKDKTAEGKVKIRMLIDLSGKISGSRIEENGFKDKSLGNCLMAKMKGWVFPKPRGGEIMSVAYPFAFKTAPAPAPTPEATPAAGAPPATEAASSSSPSETKTQP